MKAATKYWLIAIVLMLIIPCYLLTTGFFFSNTLPAPVVKTLIEAVRPEYVFIFFFPPGLLIFLFLNAIFRLWIKPLGKISEETRLIQNANPSYRLDISGSKSVKEIAALINKSAEKYEKLSTRLKEKIKEAGKKTEDEKNILAALISELSEGILICRHDGRLLLFNKKAKDFFSEKNKKMKTSFIGLGRSLFTLIDKNIVIHAQEDIQARLNQGKENCMTTFVIVGKNNNQLKVEALPILDADKSITGFIFILTDITRQIITDKKAATMLQNLTKSIRASLGGIRAAVETIIEFPDMGKKQQKVFNEIILKEAKILGKAIEKNQKEYSAHLHSKWPLVHISAKELANAFKLKAEEKLSVKIETQTEENLWIKADSYSMIMALYFLTAKITGIYSLSNIVCKACNHGKFITIDLIWQGKALKIDTLNKWLKMPLMTENEGIPLTLEELAGHHNAEILPHSFADDKKLSSLKLFFPPVKRQKSSNAPMHALSMLAEQRPEFYDFDLFNREFHSSELDDVPLTDLSYTVFDTETTGLDPSGGDEIISIGAVRIVNGKLLHNDIFEQLINPKRKLTESSIKIHGIEPEMLIDQPDINSVLPQFYTYTEETILIGHNVAFDMAMLKVKEKSTGVKFTAPVLDTLLLSAVVNPEQKTHNIETITEKFGISVIGRHTAVGDAIATAEMFLKMIDLLAGKKIYTLKEAIEASKKTFYARLNY